MTALTCDGCRELGPDVALGLASGPDRAAVLEHALGCRDCRRDLEDLTETVERSLVLAPRVEPPAGFESAVLASFGRGPVEGPVGRVGRVGRVALVAAAALLLAALGIGVGWSVLHRDQPAGWAVRDRAGAVVGRVDVERGDRATLVVHLDGGVPAATYRVECDYEAGGPYRAGVVVTEAGRPTEWRATVDVPVYDLRRVRLVSTTGAPNLEATVDG